MEDSIALIVGAQETVQDSGKVGTGLKAMAVNLSGVKASAKDGTIELNKTAKGLREIAGIDVFSDKSKGEIKSMMQIFGELNSVWDTLQDKDRRALGEAIGGKHHINTLMALMSNWDAVVKYQEDYNNGWTVGSAQQEQARYLDSAEGKINILKENLKSLVTTTISTDMFKGLLDGAISFTGALNNIISAFDKIGMTVPLVAGTLSALFSSIKALGTGQAVTPNFLVGGLGNLVKSSKQVEVSTKALTSTLTTSGASIVRFDNNSKKLTRTYKALPKTFDQASKSASKYSVSQRQVSQTGQALVTNGQRMSTTFSSIGKSATMATAKNLAMGAGLTLLNGLFMGLATAGIVMAVKALDNYVNRVDKAREANQQQMNETKQEISNYKSKADSLRAIQKEYDALSNKTDRTSEESARLVQLTQQVADLMPELIVGYDTQGNAIINLRGDVADLIGDLDRAIEKEAKLLTSQKKTQAKSAVDKLNEREYGGFGKGANAVYDTAQEKLNAISDDYNTKLEKIKSDRDKIMSDMGSSDEKHRDKYQKKLKENLQKEIDLQDEYNEKYSTKLSELQGYSNEIADAIFPSIQSNGNLSSKVKDELMALQYSLDFSDLTTHADVSKAEKALISLGEASAKGDIKIQDLKKSVDKANDSFNNGEMSFSDYHKTMSEWATKASEVTGSQYDYSFWYDLFAGMSEGAIKADRDLEGFLSTFGKTTKDLSSGDEIAKQLQRQFDSVSSTLDDMINLEPNVGVEPILEMANNKDLPTEISNLLKSLSSDGKFTMEDQQIAIDVMMAFQQGDTEGARKLIQDVNKKLEAEGKPTIDIEALFDDKEARKKVEDFNNNLKQFEDEEIIAKIKMETNLEEKGELDSLNEMLEKFKTKESKLSFIADCSDAFKGVTSLDEAVQKIPDSKKLKYNVGIEKGSELAEIKKQVDTLPKEIRTMIYAETIGLEQVELVQQLVKKFGEEDAVAKLNVSGATEALAECETLDDFLGWLEGKEIQAKVEVTGTEEAQQEIESAREEMEEYDGTTATGEVDVEGVEEANQKVEETKDTLDEVDGKEVSVKVKEDGATKTKEEVKELKETVESADGKEVEVKANSTQVLDSIKDIETLIKYSTQMKDGKYKLDIEANTEQAVNSLRDLEIALGQVSNRMTNTPTTTLRIETAQSAQNLSGLKIRIAETQTALSELQSKDVNVNTAQSAKNLSGLTVRVQEYTSAISGVLSRDINVNTAQSAKNISGLIAKIEEYNGTKPNTLTFTTNASSVASQVRSLASAVKSVPSGKTIKYNIQTIGSVPKLSAPRNITYGVQTGADIQAQTLGIQSQLRDGINANPITVGIGFSPINPPSIPTPFATNGMGNTTLNGTVDALKYGLEMFIELENRIKKVSDQLDILSKKAEKAVGSEKIKYLKEQVTLYEKQKKLQKELESGLKQQSNYLKTFLKNKGFKFDASGEIQNYHTKLIAMEKEAERLDKLASKDKASDSTKKKAEDYRKNLDEIKKAMSEYLDITTNGIPGAQKEWEDLNNSIFEANNEIEELNRKQKLFAKENKLKELENQYDSISDKLDIIEEKMKNAYGKDKQKLISEQIKLLEQQQKKQKEIVETYKSMLGTYKEDLGKYGFKFDKAGDVTNIDEILNKYQNSKDLEKIKKLLDEYLDIQRDKLPDAEKDWIGVGNAVTDAKEELEEMKKAQDELLSDAKLHTLKDAYEDLGRELSKVEKLLEHAHGKEKLDLLDKQIALIKQQQAELEKQQKFLNDKKNNLGKELSDLGFKFDEDGDITNHSAQLDKLFSQGKDVEKVKDILEEYFKLQNDEIPDLEDKYLDLENSIKDALKEQLETTKDVQDKIKDIYKKQVEERKKLIDEELKHRLDALNKEKDAYNKYRDEAKYKDSYEDQMDAISELQKKIDIASKDGSLSGQKKLKELMKQLEEEQKKLQEMVQDKIDSDINDLFDKESDRLEQEAEDSKEDLDDKYSDEKLQEIVDKTLSTGIFEDINGDLHSLQDVMLDYINKYEDGMSAIGSIIKSEWITNLEIAKDTMSDMASILEGLNLQDMASKSMSFSVAPSYDMPGSKSISQSVEFNQPLLVINGNVDRDVVEDLEKLGARLKQEVINEIARQIR